MGIAHSIEAWEDDTLVGGLYGVCVNGTCLRVKVCLQSEQ